MLNKLERKLLDHNRLPYQEFLEASYEHLLGMSEKINDPEYMDKSLIDRDRLEVLIIDTMMRIRKELGLKEEGECDALHRVDA